MDAVIGEEVMVIEKGGTEVVTEEDITTVFVKEERMDHLEEFSLAPTETESKEVEEVLPETNIRKRGRPLKGEGSTAVIPSHKCRYCATGLRTEFRREVHERIHKHLYAGFALALEEKDRQLAVPELDEEEFAELTRIEEEEKGIVRKVLKCLKISPIYSTLSINNECLSLLEDEGVPD